MTLVFLMEWRQAMNLNKYTTFLKVVEYGSITAAASKLGHTQSGVTQLLHSLENEVGVRLLIRNRQGIQLTSEGRKLLPYIQHVVDANDKFEHALKQLKQDKYNTIRIGAFTSVAVNWLPEIIKEYQQIAPDIHFDLIDCGYNNIEESLTKEQMDFGFVPLPISLRCKCIPVYEDRLLAVFPKGHPRAQADSCPISVFTEEPVISLLPTIDRDARTVYEKHHITPNIKYTVKDDYAMLAMVEKNLGICIMPELLLSGNGNSQHFQALELSPPASRTIGIAFPDYDSVNENAKQFAAFAADWIKQHK